jgi:hypothetical protein
LGWSSPTNCNDAAPADATDSRRPTADATPNTARPVARTNQKGKNKAPQHVEATIVAQNLLGGNKNPSYENAIYYNCGEPGHNTGKCSLPKACFICKKVNHEVEDYPVRRQAHSTARYIGSATTGLDFYHIDMRAKTVQNNATKNVGCVLQNMVKFQRSS